MNKNEVFRPEVGYGSRLRKGKVLAPLAPIVLDGIHLCLFLSKGCITMSMSKCEMNAKCRENKELYSHGPYPAAYVSFSGIRVTVARLTIFCLFLCFLVGRSQRSRSCIREDLRCVRTEMTLPLGANEAKEKEMLGLCLLG